MLPATKAILLVPWFAPVSFSLGPAALAIGVIVGVTEWVGAPWIAAFAAVGLCKARVAHARHGGCSGWSLQRKPRTRNLGKQW